MLWVGIGVPKQEKWMARMRDRLEVPVMCGVGAAFDFHAGRVSQAPRWMQERGLEWIYRIAQEPRRLLPRYLLLQPALRGRVRAPVPGRAPQRSHLECSRMSERVAVVGLGRVGLPLALSFADRGLEVIGVEREPAVLDQIAAGRMPFRETGTQELLERVLASGRFELTRSVAGRRARPTTSSSRSARPRTCTSRSTCRRSAA